MARNLSQIELSEVVDALAAATYKAQSAHQTGIYVNAALGAAWVDLTSVDFLSMGAAGAGGPVACDANVDFAEVTIWNDSANTVYFVLRPHFVGPGPGFVPEVPATTAFPVPAGGVVTKGVSLIDGGDPIFTISIIASGAGSAVRVNANFASR